MTDSPSDEELVQAVRRGDRQALEGLFERYRDPIYRYLLPMLGDPDEAADLTQETFLRALSSLERLRQAAAFRVWLYRIAVNLARDARRRQTPVVSLDALSEGEDAEESLPLEIVDDSADPEQLVLAKERRQAIWSAVRGLPEEQREAVVLHYFQDMEIRDIARVLEIPLGTVASRLMRARERLRRRLAEWVEGDRSG